MADEKRKPTRSRSDEAGEKNTEGHALKTDEQQRKPGTDQFWRGGSGAKREAATRGMDDEDEG